MTQPKEYEIDGVKLIMKPLTIGQVKELGKILSELDIDEKTEIKDLADKLLEEKLPQLFQVIFPNSDVDKIDFDTVLYETVDGMVEDFLSLNPRLIKRLKTLLLNLTPRAGAAMPS